MRYPAALLSVLLLFSIFSTISVTESARSDAGRSGFDLVFDTLTVEKGEVLVYENLTILVKETLTVNGSLRLNNCTLQMNNSLGIDPRVLVNGSLDICDLDDDIKTSADSSSLFSAGSPIVVLGNGDQMARHLDINCSSISNCMISRAYVRVRGGYLEDVHMDNVSVDAWSSLFNRSTIRYPLRMPRNCTFKGGGLDHAIIMGGDIGRTYSLNDLTFMEYDVALQVEKGNVSMNGCRFENVEKAINATGPLSLGNVSISSTTFYNSSIVLENIGYATLYDVNMSYGHLMRSNGPTYIRDSEFYRVVGLEGMRGGHILDTCFIECERGLIEPEYVKVSGNHFRGCDIAIDEDLNCLIYHNGFLENDRDASGFTVSRWYNVTIQEGNFYSSYNGKDNGEGGRRADDGIGDTNLPYIGRDRFPLMMDNMWLMPKIKELKVEYENGSSEVMLNWTVSGSEHYIIHRSMSENFNTGTDIWSTDMGRLTVGDNPNGTVYFRMQTFNEHGARGFSMVRSANVDRFPCVPANVRSMPMPEGNAIEVKWEHVGEDIQKVRIMYGLSDQGSFSVADVPYPQNTKVLTGLQNGKEYSIGLMAIDHLGQPSDHSEILKEVPADTLPPPPPRNVFARVRGNTSIEVFWSPPEIQDLDSYIIYRQGPDGGSFDIITVLPSDMLSYLDTGLWDNTTYFYGIAAVDDDGPVSDMGGPVEARTDHHNNPPESKGGVLFIEFNEDEGPASLDLNGLFFDPDGDTIEIFLIEAVPFSASILEGVLWIFPDADQSGEGYVYLIVSDNEDSEGYWIGVNVISIPDPPSIVRIVSPSNGSVLIPGSTVTMVPEIFDPDVETGDVLNITWTSDKDGVIFRSNVGTGRATVLLSPGIHRIDLEVEDSTGNVGRDSVMVVVSVWGWGEMPWKVATAPVQDKVTFEGGLLSLHVHNNGSLLLTFRFDPQGDEASSLVVAERTLVLSPGTSGLVKLEIVEGLEPGSTRQVSINITATTFNGTDAGSFVLVSSFQVEDVSEEGGETELMVAAIVGAGLIIVVCLYIAYTIMKKRFTNSEPIGDDVDGGH